MVLTSHSPEETWAFGVKLAKQLQPGDVLALVGDLGGGKTTFVHGLAEGLGVPPGSVASPSFVLIREYRGRMPIFHADLFRLERLPEAATVGLEEYYDGEGVTVIEWANRLPQLLPPEYLEIQFDLVNAKSRRLHVTPHGKRYAEITVR
jgi:tRNA threonylcarbamoyladenosine biosynthesis protein TsaE